MLAAIETLQRGRPERYAALESLERSPPYANSVLLDILKAQAAHPFLGEDLAIVPTDFDFTYNMNRSDSWDTLELNNYLRSNNVPEITISGNDFPLQLEKFRRFGMAHRLPPVISTDVGNEIWVLQKRVDGQEPTSGDYIPDSDWDKKMQEEKGFTYETVYPLCLKAMEQLNAEFRAQGIELGLHLQPLYDIPNILHHKPEMAAHLPEVYVPEGFVATVSPPGRYKISFHFSVPPTQKELRDVVKARFTELVYEVVPSMELSASESDMVDENGWPVMNLDACAVLKDETVAYMAKKYGAIAAVCGDSGNDLKMLLRNTEYDNVGLRVIVGGYKDDVIHAINGLLFDVECGERIRVTNDGRVFYIENRLDRKGPLSIKQAVKEARILYLRQLRQAS